jgi:hypothetical protein
MQGSIPVNVLCDHAFHTPFGLQLCEGEVCRSWLRTDEASPTSKTAGPISSATLLRAHEILPNEIINDRGASPSNQCLVSKVLNITDAEREREMQVSKE